jgi:hypothetical protein
MNYFIYVRLISSDHFFILSSIPTLWWLALIVPSRVFELMLLASLYKTNI